MEGWRMTEMEQQMKGTVVEGQRERDNDGDGGKTRQEGWIIEGERVEQIGRGQGGRRAGKVGNKDKGKKLV